MGRSLGVPAFLSGSRARHIVQASSHSLRRVGSARRPLPLSLRARRGRKPLRLVVPPHLRGGLDTLRRVWAGVLMDDLSLCLPPLSASSDYAAASAQSVARLTDSLAGVSSAICSGVLVGDSRRITSAR